MGVWGSRINRWVCRAVVLIDGCVWGSSINRWVCRAVVYIDGCVGQ